MAVEALLEAHEQGGVFVPNTRLRHWLTLPDSPLQALHAALNLAQRADQKLGESTAALNAAQTANERLAAALAPTADTNVKLTDALVALTQALSDNTHLTAKVLELTARVEALEQTVSGSSKDGDVMPKDDGGDEPTGDDKPTGNDDKPTGGDDKPKSYKQDAGPQGGGDQPTGGDDTPKGYEQSDLMKRFHSLMAKSRAKVDPELEVPGKQDDCNSYDGDGKFYKGDGHTCKDDGYTGGGNTNTGYDTSDKGDDGSEYTGDDTSDKLVSDIRSGHEYFERAEKAAEEEQTRAFATCALCKLYQVVPVVAPRVCVGCGWPVFTN